MATLAARTIQKNKSFRIPAISKNQDKRAREESINAYGSFIWALARKFTASQEEAQAAAHEIFIDIWLFAERGARAPSTDDLLTSLIARRRLIRYLQ